MEKQGNVQAGITPCDVTDKPSVKVVGNRALSQEELDKQRMVKKASKPERLKTMGVS